MKKKCQVCGRLTNRTHAIKGYKCVCSKHMHQIFQHGHPLDSNPRTNNDLNDYVIAENGVYFNLYNQRNEKIGEFVIDFEDIEKIKYHKWRISHNHVVTGLPAKHTQKDLSWVVLGITQEYISNNNIVVDHKDGNAFNNRKNNLRICTQSENALNKSFISNNTSGFIGVSYRKDRNSYDPEIRINFVRCHLGFTRNLEEAVYKRYYAEKLVFKEFANEAEQGRKRNFTKNLTEETKKHLRKIVEQKLKTKGLWQ